MRKVNFLSVLAMLWLKRIKANFLIAHQSYAPFNLFLFTEHEDGDVTTYAVFSFDKSKLKELKRRSCLALTWILLSLAFVLPAAAQNTPSDLKPLKIGSKLPESFWMQEHLVYAKGKTIKQNLSQYRNKLLILDFWATWCSSCTHKFRYIDSLQKEYEGLAVVLLVDAKSTRDTPEKIAVTMKRFNDQLTTLMADTVLSQQFVHTSVPHYIWIAGGYFLAASGSEFMHKGNLDAILGRQQHLQKDRKRRTTN
ncbi:MAG: TlpA family protein disulfide reductase [Sphingobacteriales bacterium]|nr:MAG: TlpA family protein disulfide reductase [Sphingobacteriales bacterium]